MRHDKPGCCRGDGGWAWLLLLATLLSALGWHQTASGVEPVRTLREAFATLEPAGAPATSGLVKLSHRWDEHQPGRDGHATYRLELPEVSGSTPSALLFSRVGNQVEVRINGKLVERFGSPGDTRFDAAKTSWLVNVPATMLSQKGPNGLEVEVWCQSGRWGGLSTVQYGPAAALEPVYRSQRFWRSTAAVVMAAGLSLLGLTALALWWRQRLALFGWFAAAALTGLVRHVDHVWPDVPLPWPALGAFVAASYAMHLGLMLRTAREMLGASSVGLHRAMLASMVLSASLAVASFAMHMPKLWSMGLIALVPWGLIVTGQTLRASWAARRSVLGGTMLVAMALVLMAAAFDLLGVRLGLSRGSLFSVLPFALFTIALAMAGVIVARYNQTVMDYRTLNAQLEHRVAERERQLGAAFEVVQQRDREQAVSQERQRLMREIHDGVGAQLVLLLNLASQGQADPKMVEEQAKAALDEMRMAVDSLQPVHGDLGTVLATLRYRLQPRLESAGLKVDWQAQPLPPLDGLTPTAVLQVQRILLEGFANVLRHARASTIRVSAEVDTGQWPNAILLVLQDDGLGVPADVMVPHLGRGHGVGNMLARAEAIGARLVIEPAQPRGTKVTLRWPLVKANQVPSAG